MSQRLAIGQDRDGYDAFIASSMSVATINKMLRDEWICLRSNGSYLGGWKIFIYDKDLFKKVSPLIHQLFTELGQEYPECVWFFYSEDNGKINHPSRKELNEWIDKW